MPMKDILIGGIEVVKYSPAIIYKGVQILIPYVVPSAVATTFSWITWTWAAYKVVSNIPTSAVLKGFEIIGMA